MPRDDAAKLIAQNLHNLRAAPGGKPVRLMQYSTLGHAPENAAQITKGAQAMGDSIVHLLESNGYKISHEDDPQPGEQLGQFPTLSVTCKHCKQPLLELAHITNDPEQPNHLESSLGKLGIETAGLRHDCWS